jgi:hypothetical protein
MTKLVMKKIDPAIEEYWAKRNEEMTRKYVEEHEKAKKHAEEYERTVDYTYTAASGTTMPNHDEWFTVNEIKARRAVYGSYHDTEVDWLIDRVEGLETVIRWMLPHKRPGDHDFCENPDCQCWANEPDHAQLLREVLNVRE